MRQSRIEQDVTNKPASKINVSSASSHGVDHKTATDIPKTITNAIVKTNQLKLSAMIVIVQITANIINTNNINSVCNVIIDSIIFPNVIQSP